MKRINQSPIPHPLPSPGLISHKGTKGTKLKCHTSIQLPASAAVVEKPQLPRGQRSEIRGQRSKVSGQPLIPPNATNAQSPIIPSCQPPDPSDQNPAPLPLPPKYSTQKSRQIPQSELFICKRYLPHQSLELQPVKVKRKQPYKKRTFV